MGGAPADEEAEKAKEEGNKAFAKGNFALAAESFTLAINLDPNNHVYYANRSAALLKMGKLEDALDDADRAIKLNRFYAKAHYRKGQALAVIGRFFSVFRDLLSCLSSMALSSGLDTKAASPSRACLARILRVCSCTILFLSAISTPFQSPGVPAHASP